MQSATNLFVGIDIGTSGIRAVCVNDELHELALASVAFQAFDGSRTDPAIWVHAVEKVLIELLDKIPAEHIKAIAVDGTSGTMIATNDNGHPLSQAMMYNDVCNNADILSRIAAHAPSTSAAHGASSGLAKAIQLSTISGVDRIQHEADWVASALSGKLGVSDENNALKTGYDPVNRCWPSWIADTGMNTALLPTVLRAGEPIARASGWLAKQVGLPNKVLVVAGTTDGCASFLATGASEPGDGVTVLGSTITIKLLSNSPIYAPEYGIYSHRIGDSWLAGGASNSGGQVLEHHFSSSELNVMIKDINPAAPSGLSYYPLLSTGERFPINDSDLQPRLTPRPSSNTAFLQGILEGFSAIEKLAYGRLAELGGPQAQSIRTIGGGASNAVWTQIRKNAIPGVSFQSSLSKHAATGTAILAKRGALEAGILH